MSMPDETRREVISGFGNIVKTGPLAGTLDLQQTMIFLDRLLAQSEASAVPLEPLHQYLVGSLGCAPDAVTETLVFFISRGSRWGVGFVEPPHIQGMPPAQRQEILDAWASQGATTGTYAASPRETVAATKKAEERKQRKTAAEAAAASKPKPKPKGGGGIGVGLVSPKLLIAVGIAVAALVGNLVLSSMGDPKPIDVASSDGLNCESARGVPPIMFCFLPADSWDLMRTEEREARMKATLQKARANGFTELRVKEVGDPAMLAEWPPASQRR